MEDILKFTHETIWITNYKNIILMCILTKY